MRSWAWAGGKIEKTQFGKHTSLVSDRLLLLSLYTSAKSVKRYSGNHISFLGLAEGWHGIWWHRIILQFVSWDSELKCRKTSYDRFKHKIKNMHNLKVGLCFLCTFFFIILFCLSTSCIFSFHLIPFWIHFKKKNNIFCYSFIPWEQ